MVAAVIPDRGSAAVAIVAAVALVGTLVMVAWFVLAPALDLPDPGNESVAQGYRVDELDADGDGATEWLLVRSLHPGPVGADGLTGQAKNRLGQEPLAFCRDPSNRSDECQEQPGKGVPWNRTEPLFSPCPGPGSWRVTLELHGRPILSTRVQCGETPRGGFR